MKISTRDIPPPPDEPAAFRSCDAGYCDAESIGWRFYPTPEPGRWLPVCERDMRTRAEFRALDADRFDEFR